MLINLLTKEWNGIMMTKIIYIMDKIVAEKLFEDG